MYGLTQNVRVRKQLQLNCYIHRLHRGYIEGHMYLLKKIVMNSGGSRQLFTK